MGGAIDREFLIGQTTIHVVSGKLPQDAGGADALVSSDDVYLTMSGGVSRDISEAAGESLRQDARKQQFPLAIGSVVVTSAGRLPARYVLHATTLDFQTRPPAEALIARLMQRILEIGKALGVQHIALPLLGAGTAGLSEAAVLDLILRSAAFHLASESFPLRRLTVVILESAQVQATIEKFAQDVAAAEQIESRIEKLRSAREALPDDEELRAALNARIGAASEELCDLFRFAALDDGISLEDGLPLTAQEKQERRENLRKALDRLKGEVDHKKELQHIYVRNREELEKKEAQFGLHVPSHVVTELEYTQKMGEELSREIAELEAQKLALQRQFDALG